MINGSMLNGSSTSNMTNSCNQCGEKRNLLPYIFPTQSGKREFCSEPCLSAYRSAQKGMTASMATTLQTNSQPQTPSVTENSTARMKLDLDFQVSPNNNPRYHEEITDGATSFSWADYLRETGGEAAPTSYFMQAPVPPANEFELETKLEAKDPRSQSNCIGKKHTLKKYYQFTLNNSCIFTELLLDNNNQND